MILKNGVKWDHKTGIGFYPVNAHLTSYDDAYFEKYVGYAKSKLGEDLNRARVEIVNRFARDLAVVDVGIGCGQFVQSRKNTFGYDVNLRGIQFLLNTGAWWDPWFKRPINLTFWDSFEHLENPHQLIERCREFVFMSIPIFDGPEHIERSKHFRPDEHYWYFSRNGLVLFMHQFGFKIVFESDIETRLGREDIMTFVFQRVA